jgi:phosphatidylglycerophosphate synthase
MTVLRPLSTPSANAAATAAGDPAAAGSVSDADRLRATQKKQDAVSVYFARKVSPHITPVFLKLGISANQATAVWGLISLATSYVIYLSIAGHYALVPVIFALYFVVVVIDCVDGEVARYRNTASPIGGKLLDGVWHKATEYSLLGAYLAGAYFWTHSSWLFPLGLVLISGEAMYTYVYERRLLVIRVFAKSSEYINPVTENDLYRKDERWRDFPIRKKVNAFKGLIQYKSVYFMIAISILSPQALLAGVVVLTVYKHVAWIKLVVRTLNRTPRVEKES